MAPALLYYQDFDHRYLSAGDDSREIAQKQSDSFYPP